ncbi:tRNA (adenosine(37)-N6)-threonylcarbamoyltransferase complex ATPase subunit type 1 TsaE [bacterium]|jgi:tRNA threonylcarbamoyladenosine biosynthesis protein TsaE|nr:tRNA (adenosine(37)-N6)-threonylcarbamoyltransferase complex ATPase subunit type 1 TsaE [bacterium]
MASSILAELRTGVVTTSAEDTRALAARLAAALLPGSVLALHGDLGAGKTTFVQGFAAGLGIHETVTSPTFNIFTLHRGAGRTLVHLDAYRLDSGAQLADLMIEDFLVPPWWLAVEWPEKVADWLPSGALHLDLGHAPGAGRYHSLRLRG